ncbi:conjugal transfer protein TraX [Pseudomonas fulva]|nr:TraX family protein [Pseudomonas fulva]MBF8780270.1 conjugal transfer protein TraX [Pseudomonas fulva]
MNSRSAGLDLVKWVAILSMLGDHLRYLWPMADGLFIPGRLAFPLFCLVMACHVRRSPRAALHSHGNARYLCWMVAFCVFSEPPYRWLDSESQTFSIMPTLTLGLLSAWGVHHAGTAARLTGLLAVLAATWASPVLMYGLPGVLLPAAWLQALGRGGLAWLLPCSLAVGANLTNSWLSAHPFEPIALLILSMAALAIPLGLWLLRHDHLHVWPVGRWAYGFYPLHLAALGWWRGLG